MKFSLVLLLFFLLNLSCSDTSKENMKYSKKYAQLITSDSSDKLIPITNEDIYKFDAACAFINQNGDTIIPFGRFSVFETDTFSTFTFVKDEKMGVVGINRKGEILFDAFLYGDVQLDNFSEGLIRIKQNGKIGFADKTGKIVIKPRYSCAYPFCNGKSKVTYSCTTTKDEMEQTSCSSPNWFYIDKHGNRYEKKPKRRPKYKL